MSESLSKVARVYGILLARILMGSYFLISGYSKVADMAGTTNYIAQATNLPHPQLMAIIAAAVEIYSGLALIFGFSMAFAALSLIVFTLATSYFFHHPGFWSKVPMQQVLFMKNAAIVSGLLYILAYGKGDSWHVGQLQNTDTPSEEPETSTPEQTH